MTRIFQSEDAETVTRPAFYVAFEEQDNLPTEPRIVDLRQEASGNLVEFVYSNPRVEAFLDGRMDYRVGTCDVTYYPIRHGKRTYVQDQSGQWVQSSKVVTADIMGLFNSDVYLCWAMGPEGEWHETKMDQALGQNRVRLVLEEGEGFDQLRFYFKLVGKVVVIPGGTRFVPREMPNHQEYEKEMAVCAWLQDDGRPIERATVYDNPNGPFTNYSLLPSE